MCYLIKVSTCFPLATPPSPSNPLPFYFCQTLNAQMHPDFSNEAVVQDNVCGDIQSDVTRIRIERRSKQPVTLPTLSGSATESDLLTST